MSVVGAASFEGAVGGEEDGHVVVCVVAPPDAHAGGAVEAEVFRGAPECFEAADGFGVLPPLGSPSDTTLDVELTSVRDRQLVADEFGDVGVEQLRRIRLVLGRLRGSRGAL